MHRLALVLVVLFSGCGGGSKPSSETTLPPSGSASAPGSPAGATCAEAADHTIEFLSKGQPDAPPQVVKKIRDTLATHCEKDHWSVASRDCFAHIQTPDDGNKCEQGLTPAQQESLNKEGSPDGASPGTTRGPRRGGDPEDGGQ